jgi:nitrogen fixation NifU-like protein
MRRKMALNNQQFEELVQQLQNQSFEDARSAFGEKGFNRWRNPQYHGLMEDADSHARIRGGCGDTMEIFLKFEDNRVQKASYVTDGCGSSALCGSFTAELAHGKSPEELFELSPDDILETIGTFPEKDGHCAKLSILTLHEALNVYLIKQATK